MKIRSELKEICTLETFATRLIQQIDIPKRYIVVYHMAKNSIEFDIRKIGENHKYVSLMQSIFRSITAKSSVGERFKLDIKTEYKVWGNNIHVIITAYPRINEKTEDLVTILRLEGLI